MQQQQYDEVKSMKNIMGQFVTIISVTDQTDKVLPQFKADGIRKVSKFQCHVRSDNYIDLLNKSSKADELGIEVKAKRKSYYSPEAHKGFCCHLNSDPDKKYFEVKWTEKDKPVDDSFYLDAKGVIRKAEEVLKDKKKNDRARLADAMRVQVRQFKIESIALMRVGGKTFVDPELKKFTDFTLLFADLIADKLE